jgi:cellulose biosynthesis protein BcsQ
MGHLLSELITPILTAICTVIGGAIGAVIQAYFAHRKINTLKDRVDKQDRQIDGFLESLKRDDELIWKARPRQLPFANYEARIDHAEPVILTVANLKGGVGKTTVVANLAGYFSRRGKSVLLIDLDYQGSLTTLLRSLTDQVDRESLVNQLLADGANLGVLFNNNALRELSPTLARSYLIPAFYELARLEDRLMCEWLLEQSPGDVRYRLARALLGERTERFDVIIIDTPPRLTTGTINALCASTHLLIPTIFNPISVEPIENFLGLIKTLLINDLNTRLKVVGILETLTPPQNQQVDNRNKARATIDAARQKWFSDVPILESNVPRRAPLADEGVSSKNEITAIFDNIGNEIIGKLGL